MKFGLQAMSVKHSSNLKTDWNVARYGYGLRSCLSCWEIYLILLIAAVLRFYLINRTEFDGDQATIFSMAYDAVSHGHLVATSNVASIGIVNPPAIIYILMLPAALSANPVWGAVLTAVFGTLAVLLTYVFVLRYYGRLAAIIASLLYATAALPVFYSRFMWQQNLLLFFAPLYILLLFCGAVARRQGWFGFAIFLLGLLVQLHGSALLLVVPLIVALAAAPSTVRWRDVILGLLLLLLIYAPYLLWETSVHFQDISVLFNTTGRPSKFDVQALALYQSLLSPYNLLAISPRSLLFPFVSVFTVVWWITTVLVIGGAVLALGLVFGLPSTDRKYEPANEAFTRVRSWWSEFCASPYRCGLSILLSWQVVPLLALMRHSITLYPHYFIMFMPGPFILVGFFVAEVIVKLRQAGWWSLGRRSMFFSLMSVMVIAQTIGATVSVADLTNGKFVDATHTLSSLYYNDLNSLQHALAETDQIAQARHVHHVYIDADNATIDAFHYLSRQMHTPTTVFSDTCVVLPNLAHGPVILLVGAHSNLTESLLPDFVTASLIATPARLGGPPFRMYVLSSIKQSITMQDTLAPDLQFLGTQSFSFQHTSLLLTRWRFLLSYPAVEDTLYSYNLISMPNAATVASMRQNTTRHPAHRAINRVRTVKCALTSVQAGDQLLVSVQPPAGQQAPFNLKVQVSTMKADDFTLGIPSFPFAFETFRPLHNTQQMLVSRSGNSFVSISPSAV